MSAAAISSCSTIKVDLRSNDAATLGAACVVVLGYTTIADGGGGLFVWDEDTASADNRGTVIVPAITPRTGCWKRLFSGPMSVKWFGAVGDCFVDDYNVVHGTD